MVRSFDGNLGAYHALNRKAELKVDEFSQRLSMANTLEEMQQIHTESLQYFKEKEQQYKELGEEMVNIMNKPWWRFW